MSLDFVFFVFVVVVRVESWQGKIATSSYISCFCVGKNSSRGEFGRALFALYFVGFRRTPVPWKDPKGQKRPFQLGSWKGPKNHNSFLAYKTSGFVRWQKKPRNRKSRDPKSVQKNALYFEPQLSLREAKKAKYVTFSTDFPEIRHTPKFVPKKIVTFQAAQRWQNRYLSASLRHRETPIKQARNRVWGNLDASWGPNSPSWRAKCDQIPLLQHIYIYIHTHTHTTLCALRQVSWPCSCYCLSLSFTSWLGEMLASRSQLISSCVYLHVCAHVICARVCVCVYVCLWAKVCVCVCLCMYMSPCVCVCVCVSVCGHVRVHQHCGVSAANAGCSLGHEGLQAGWCTVADLWEEAYWHLGGENA